MAQADILSYAKLRLAVGCLGESIDPPWWQAGLFSSESDAFLTPVFPRTQWLARMTATSEAAARLHDEHIGVGRVFHLFRLPEALEQQIAEVAKGSELIEQLASVVGGDGEARALIDQLATGGNTVEGAGPLRLGSPDDLAADGTLAAIAAAYRRAFNQEIKVYPYVSDREG